MNREETNRIFIHCSATDKDTDSDVHSIRAYHMGTKGWSDVGYHYVITRCGWLQEGRHMDKQGAHVRGENADSIGICLIGGIDTNGNPQFNFNKRQLKTLDGLVTYLKRWYGDHLTVHAHNEFANKACPSFDVAEYYKGCL